MKSFCLFVLACLACSLVKAGNIVLPSVAASIRFTDPPQTNNLFFGNETNASGEGFTQVATVDGIVCRKIPAGKFMYVNCNRTAVPTTAQQIILSVTYYDNSMNYVWLNYTRGSNGWGGADFKKTNTKKWITRLIILKDAALNGSMGYSGDIRMGYGSEDNYIKDITVYLGTLNADGQPIPAKPNNPGSEFKGKSFAGYQLWHEAGPNPADWRHWSYGMLPAAGRGNHNTEMFPQIADYASNPGVMMYNTNFANLGNGNPAKLYNSTDKGVIDVQMNLLKNAGFDGVAIQRNAPVGRDLKYTSTDDYYVSIKNACEANGRLFHVMYCMPDINNGAQMSEDLVDGIKRDWVFQMEQIYALTSSPAYATVNGKPVVELWGLGYSTILVDKPQALALAQFFKDRGCYVIAGVPRDWRLRNEGSRTDFTDVYKAYNSISPWTVGVYNDTTSADAFKNNYMVPDKLYCDQNGMDFYPVIMPGSAWSQHVTGYPNDTRREAGKFLWRQATNIKSVGVPSMYFAMLDEFEESTNIINAGVDYFDIPTDQYFGTLSMDGTWVSADYYLRLAGAAARMLTSPTTPATIPIAHSNGPIYYRNSFESRIANCMINGAAQNILSPIDPCFYKPAALSSAGVSNTSVAIVGAGGFSKSGSYSVKIDGTATGSGAYYYRMSETKIAVKANMQLSFWKYTVNSGGRYASIDLYFKSGKVLHNLTGYTDNNGNPIHPATGRGTVGAWEKFTCQIGKGELINDEITGIAVAYDKPSLSGSFTAYFDDVIIEDALDTTPPVTNDAPIGSTVYFTNSSKYVCSENGTTAMNCNRATQGPWEVFTVVDAGNGLVALKGNNGKYVTTGTPMQCTATAIGNDTRFTWVKLSNTTVALKGFNNMYVSSEAGNAPMNCNRATIGGWETFGWGTVSSGSLMSLAVNSPDLFTIYPNPATTDFSVNADAMAPADVKMEVVDMNGVVLQRLIRKHPGGHQRWNVPLTHTIPGVYFVRFSWNGQTETHKLIVQ